MALPTVDKNRHRDQASAASAEASRPLLRGGTLIHGFLLRFRHFFHNEKKPPCMHAPSSSAPPTTTTTAGVYICTYQVRSAILSLLRKTKNRKKHLHHHHYQHQHRRRRAYTMSCFFFNIWSIYIFCSVSSRRRMRPVV